MRTDPPSTETERVARTLFDITSILDSRNVAYRVAFYSQGETSDYAAPARPSTEFFPMRTRSGPWELIEAWETSPSEWITRELDGSFDQTAFGLQLRQLLENKAKSPSAFSHN